MADDQPRYLHRRSEHGYTRNPLAAMRGEPEALSADDLDDLADQARRRERDTLAGEWRKTAERIRGAVAHFAGVAHSGDDLRSDLRAVTRIVDRVDRRLGT